MTAYRIPEPKPILILLLSIAGLVSGSIQGLYSYKLDATFSSGHTLLFLCTFSAIGGFIGVAVGTSVALCPKPWLQMLFSMVFGFGAFALAVSFTELVFPEYGWTPGLQSSVAAGLFSSRLCRALFRRSLRA